MSTTVNSDIREILADSNIPWSELENSTVLVTGATGLIGSALVRVFSFAGSITTIATGRNAEKAGHLMGLRNVTFLPHDVRKPLDVQGKIDYIFHCASITSSAEMAANPVGVISTAVAGTQNVLELAKSKAAKSMVYISSMEIYGNTSPEQEQVPEETLGMIDLYNPRSCYPESKRMCECLCACYHSQFGVPVKTARPAQVFGAGSSYGDSRVFAQFARSAILGKDIILHTEGRSRGNYCYIADAVRALILLLIRGENGEAYNVANPAASMTIREMAELVAEKIGGGKISVKYERPADFEKRGYPPDTNLRMDIGKILKLGWKPKYGLEEMYTRMIAAWEEIADERSVDFRGRRGAEDEQPRKAEAVSGITWEADNTLYSGTL